MILSIKVRDCYLPPDHRVYNFCAPDLSRPVGYWSKPTPPPTAAPSGSAGSAAPAAAPVAAYAAPVSVDRALAAAPAPNYAESISGDRELPNP